MLRIAADPNLMAEKIISKFFQYYKIKNLHLNKPYKLAYFKYSFTNEQFQGG